MAKRLVEEAVVEKKEVVVAWVPVAFRKVKFCKVVEAFASNCWKLETAVVEVAVKEGAVMVLNAVSVELKRPAPATARVVPGEVVPIPTKPVFVITK